jgi:hypothetical protein
MPELSEEFRRRLEVRRQRRAAVDAARAAFEERRRHGLKARHRAKLAYLAERAATEEETIAPESDELNNEDAA